MKSVAFRPFASCPRSYSGVGHCRKWSQRFASPPTFPFPPSSCTTPAYFRYSAAPLSNFLFPRVFISGLNYSDIFHFLLLLVWNPPKCFYHTILIHKSFTFSVITFYKSSIGILSYRPVDVSQSFWGSVVGTYCRSNFNDLGIFIKPPQDNESKSSCPVPVPIELLTMLIVL